MPPKRSRRARKLECLLKYFSKTRYAQQDSERAIARMLDSKKVLPKVP
ncbi:MAG: hypothetical protein HC878_16175 [Leptolyngbyaceae cyanobacterium SL_5_14]|nr:hypothetical protein [Leptolyngbyaceae cyanobacterium SL_5_14]